MMSMVTIDLSTKFKDNPATYEAGSTPTPCAADIWSKQYIRAKKKRKPPLVRGVSYSSSFGLGVVAEEAGSEFHRSSYQQRSPTNKPNGGGRRSPERSLQPLATLVVETEVTMSIRDLAFRTVNASDAPLSPDDMERRELIEKMLEDRERDEKLRMQADAKRSRSAVRLVIDPVDPDAKPSRKGSVGDVAPPSPEGIPSVDDPFVDGNDRGASEVILVEDSEMIVGEASHLVSRRSKRDMFKHIPNVMFEPTVTLPPPSGRIDDAATVGTARPTNNSRGSSRKSSRAKLPKTPSGTKTARTRAYFAALLATDEPLFVGSNDRDGGPCFGDDTSPAKGVVITHGLVVKSGVQWEGRQPPFHGRGMPRTVSEPVLDPIDQTPPSAQLLRRASLQRLPPPPHSIRPNDAEAPPTTESLLPSPRVLALDHHMDHHRHTTSKSMSLRIRTPACRKRRSRKVVDDLVVATDDHHVSVPSVEDEQQGNNSCSAQPPPSASTSPPRVVQRRPSTNSATVITPQKLVRSPVRQIRLPRVSSRGDAPLGSGGRVLCHSALTLPLLKQQPTLS
ncbi:hypothetical protein, variant [Aphanomyces invadans]|nr:hypothetical protein, variant [Aphanomyces invadans]ETW02366.1 hypothetical protein, variant [Aphanomyces invadans]|eukprot:XP_008868971.1 hypothetical protein, variant [Aphanomyces invadans]